MIRNIAFCVTFFVFSFISPSICTGQTTPDPSLSRNLKEYIEKVSKELKNENTELYFSVSRVPDRQEILSVGGDVPLHMASVQKLFITYAALRLLGAEYTIPTEFYTDFLPQDRDQRLDVSIGLSERSSAPEDSLGRVYVRAYGNPVFQYEDMVLVARELKARGVSGITDMVIDDSLFLEKSETSGTDPYQAAQSATSVEFNTYRVQIVPSSSGMPPLISVSPGLYGEVRNRARSLSGKGESIEISQSPSNELFPVFLKQGEMNPQAMSLQVSGRIGLKHSFWEKYYSHPDPFLYYALSFRKAFSNEGIAVKGSLLRGKVPADAHSVYTHESEPLYSILAKLNRYSSNFIAGQLLYLIGQDPRGFFSTKKGHERMKEVLDEIGVWSDSTVVYDASGLSDKNRISVNQVVHLLNEVEKDFSISPVFVSSLSRFGLSGTLKKRNLEENPFKSASRSSAFRHEESKSEAAWAKSGTVTDVSALAGYLDRYEGFRIAYAMVLSGKIEKSRAVDIENDIIRIMLGRN
jgi:serine-type D-Ala-D-Ala carboxypeptidase/endopeptidase (penicillin-binding protein 4)